MPTLRNCRSSSSSVTWPPSLRSVVFSKTSCVPQQAMKWDQLMSQATSDKLDSTARVCKWRDLHLCAVIFYQYIANFFTALCFCLCTWTCIFRNLVCARSAKPSDCEDVCTAFCRVTRSEMNEDNGGAMPVEIEGTSRNAMSQSQCLETGDEQKAK